MPCTYYGNHFVASEISPLYPECHCISYYSGQLGCQKAKEKGIAEKIDISIKGSYAFISHFFPFN